jgi:hypothetical protein
MTAPDLGISKPEACPYFGLADDPRTRFTFADPAHRCHVRAKPMPINLGHQGAYCLTTGYPTCERFRPLMAADATVPRNGRTSRGRALRRTAAALAIVALGILIGALGVGAIGGIKAGADAHDAVASPSTPATAVPPAGQTLVIPPP